MRYLASLVNVLVVMSLMLSAGPLGVPVVQAQASVNWLRLGNVDTSGFPDVRITFWAEGPNNAPVAQLSVNDVRVSEDGRSVPLSGPPQAFPAGVQLAMVVDAGGALANNAPGRYANFDEVWGEASRYLLRWVDDTSATGFRDGIDSVTLIVQQPSGSPKVVLANVSSRNDIRNALVTAPEQSDQFKSANTFVNAVNQALSTLESLRADPRFPDKPQMLVLFSSGSNGLDMKGLIERARKLQVPIHTVHLIKEINNFWPSNLASLASATGGQFVSTYDRNAPTTWRVALDGVINSFASRRTQFILTYRSTSASQSTRRIEVTVGAQTQSTTYAVVPQAPKILIQSPKNGDTLVMGRDETSGAVLPKMVTIASEITWPLGQPRRLIEAFVRLNGNEQVLPIPSANRLEFPWDIAAYSGGVTDTVTIQFGVVDELQEEYLSDPVSVLLSPEVVVVTNTETILVAPPCVLDGTGFERVCPLLPWIPTALSFLVAVFVVVFVIANRQRIQPAMTRVSQHFSEFVDRLTQRANPKASRAKAYLKALEGLEDESRRDFEIYGQTRLGRSPQFADLIFHRSREQSQVSRLHATIVEEDDRFYLRDDVSANGTYLNGIRLKDGDPGRMELHDGDRFELGQVQRGGVLLLFTLAQTDDDDQDDGTTNQAPRS